MTVTSRPYRDDDDLQRIIELVTAATAADIERSVFHVGDMLWGRYQNTVYDPRERIQLWERDDELVGFAWSYQPPALYSFQTHPRSWDQGVIEPQMLVWAEQRLRDAIAGGLDKRTLSISALTKDRVWIELLTAQGYVHTDEGSMLVMRQPLPTAQPITPLPDGFTVRAVGDEREWQARVDLHREVWHPSKVTLEAYQRLRTVAGYRSELDLVVAAPDGTLAAYCICWLDPVNRIGEFEPVGVRAAFRGQRLGRAVMQAGLQRLYEHGAQTATVYTYAGNPAAVALYRSTGFEVVDAVDLYRKTL
jgi:ribosomal protein S18 acetylase RimI-like enzyme